MKPKKDKSKTPARGAKKADQSEKNSNFEQDENAVNRNKKITNTDEEKKVTNADEDEYPKDKPVKIPSKQIDPAVAPGEKEKTKQKIPTTHPGNSESPQRS